MTENTDARPRKETLADQLDVKTDSLSLECEDCVQTFLINGSRLHDSCPNCFGSNTEVYV